MSHSIPLDGFESRPAAERDSSATQSPLHCVTKVPTGLRRLLVTMVVCLASIPEARADSVPIGHQVFQAVVEVEHPESIRAGDEVDIFQITLDGEELKRVPVVKRVRVVSVQRPPARMRDVVPEPGPSAEQDSPTDETGAPEFYETRFVKFSVNSRELEHIRLAQAQGLLRIAPAIVREKGGILSEILHNLVTNLFQPLLLFFFMGFAVPLLKVPFEFPKALYQSLTIYLLVAIGWHGGELMAQLPPAELAVAAGLAVVGFVTNGLIGYSATKFLAAATPMRRIDATTVGAYYGSDSAGTFVTCLGILASLSILHDSYMPVMLAVMEIPGCLIGLFLIARLRGQGMDPLGNMPGEEGYTTPAKAHDAEAAAHSAFSAKVFHEVFFNPGLYLLFGGIVVGFISGIQALSDPKVVEGPNHLFLFIFKGALCLFLLEMGMTACERLRDLKTAGWGFIAFGLLGPVVFATFGMCMLHGYSLLLGHVFELGTYALFAVLCAAASYIAVPAVQRIAIPEASPTLPLAASLGLTFTWNVTIGIPIYVEIARYLTTTVPIAWSFRHSLTTTTQGDSHVQFPSRAAGDDSGGRLAHQRDSRQGRGVGRQGVQLCAMPGKGAARGDRRPLAGGRRRPHRDRHDQRNRRGDSGLRPRGSVRPVRAVRPLGVCRHRGSRRPRPGVFVESCRLRFDRGHNTGENNRQKFSMRIWRTRRRDQSSWRISRACSRSLS